LPILRLHLIELRFIKFNLTSRSYQTKLSPLEGRAQPRALPRQPPFGAVERSARAWPPALQAGPVLIRQFHPSPRARGREGLLMHRVENTLSPDYARFHASLPRPEGPRQSLRSGSRSDSFWGSGQGGCTEMHYSPRIWQRRGPELPLLFPLPILPSPSSSPPPLFSPRRKEGRSAPPTLVPPAWGGPAWRGWAHCGALWCFPHCR